jgi:hypothetical protein
MAGVFSRRRVHELLQDCQTEVACSCLLHQRRVVCLNASAKMMHIPQPSMHNVRSLEFAMFADESWSLM